MKKGTKVLLFVILLLMVVICVGIGVYFLVSEVNAKNTFINEINSLSETNINTDIVSKGDYGKVEELLKNDFKTYVDSANKLVENYKKIQELKPFDIEVYKTDGPDFTNTITTINSVKDENLQISETLKELVSEGGINKKITEKALTDKFSNLYKEVQANMKLKEGIDKIVEADAKFNDFLTAILKVLDYLVDNKDKWFIENDTLKSTDKNFIDEYNELLKNTNIEF